VDESCLPPSSRGGAIRAKVRWHGRFAHLEVADLEVDVLTGIYSEETGQPQPLRISIAAELQVADRYEPDTPLSASKNYMDLKFAATGALPPGVHFKLIEAVADHICETLFLQRRGFGQ
jgi:dihydroneopterin aldolase